MLLLKHAIYIYLSTYLHWLHMYIVNHRSPTRNNIVIERPQESAIFKAGYKYNDQKEAEPGLSPCPTSDSGGQAATKICILVMAWSSGSTPAASMKTCRSDGWSPHVTTTLAAWYASSVVEHGLAWYTSGYRRGLSHRLDESIFQLSTALPSAASLARRYLLSHEIWSVT